MSRYRATTLLMSRTVASRSLPSDSLNLAPWNASSTAYATTVPERAGSIHSGQSRYLGLPSTGGDAQLTVTEPVLRRSSADPSRRNHRVVPASVPTEVKPRGTCCVEAACDPRTAPVTAATATCADAPQPTMHTMATPNTQTGTRGGGPHTCCRGGGGLAETAGELGDRDGPRAARPASRAPKSTLWSPLPVPSESSTAQL